MGPLKGEINNNIKGILLGFPSLEYKSRGMGLSVTERTHHLTLFDVHLPRLELDRRKARDKEMETWDATGDLDDGAYANAHRICTYI